MKMHLEKLVKDGLLSPEDVQMLVQFQESYCRAVVQNGYPETKGKELLSCFLEKVLFYSKNPFNFSLFHEAIRTPFDHYQFALDFIRPLVQIEKSVVKGKEQFKTVETALTQGDNVIFFANHQTEPDPQAISILLESAFPKLAQSLICVAGHRVTTDPLAIPLSMGCNLLCIYSKRYVETPPEGRQEKTDHNRRTMHKMAELLREGGRCIYVAPSGGRDRISSEGTVAPSPFDPQSIDLFWLIVKQVKRPTHFYPLALSTYNLMPPPDTVQLELGEPRIANSTPIALSLGDPIHMEELGKGASNRKEARALRAQAIWEMVSALYREIA